MTRRTILILLLSSILSACAFQSGQTWTNYTLQQTVQGSGPGRPLPVTMQVAVVDAPTWLNSRDMYYRLEYSNRQRISAYSRSRWLASPPTMLANLLVDHLSQADYWRAVVGPSSDVFTDYTLHLHLSEFEQVFKTSGQSFGVVAARASLVDAHHDLVVAQSGFRFEVAAPTANARGGAAALGKASDELANALETWLKHVLSRQHQQSLPTGGVR